MTDHSIELLTLLPGATCFNDNNIFPTWQGLARDHGGKNVKVYIKRLDPRSLFVECVAAQIGRTLGLPIPRPVLVQVLPIHPPEKLNITHSELFFGSESAGYPSLWRHADKLQIMQRLREWPHALAAGCFDEWIANDDRNLGNILYDGGKQFFLIDHSHAMRNETPVNRATKNNTILDILIVNADEVSKRRLLKHAKEKHLPSYATLMVKDWLTLVKASEYCSADMATPIISFLSERMNVLARLIALRTGDTQNDIFAGF